MKALLLIIISLQFDNLAHAQVSARIESSKNPACMWWGASAVRPGAFRYQCADGETYYYGKQVCGDRSQKHAFCNSKASSSIDECAKNFKTKTTKECFDKYIAPTLDAKYYDNKEYDGLCNWRWSGGETYNCGQDTYIFGKASCRSGVYKNIFCRYQFASSGKNCAQDKHKDTIACYSRFIKEKHPELAGVKSTFTPSGAQ